MNIRLSARARRDLLAIRSYLQERNPVAAVDVVTAIEAAVDVVREYPLACPVVGPGAARMRVVQPYGYKLFYRVRSEIVIAHVRHPSRSPDWR